MVPPAKVKVREAKDAATASLPTMSARAAGTSEAMPVRTAPNRRPPTMPPAKVSDATIMTAHATAATTCDTTRTCCRPQASDQMPKSTEPTSDPTPTTLHMAAPEMWLVRSMLAT
jgi:hypothetical protein